MTSGIKLSNLSLRDGDNVWIPFKDWKIGDLVNDLTRTDEIQNGVSIGDFLKHREGYISINSNGDLIYQTEDGSVPSTTIPNTLNLRIVKSGSNINLQYKNGNSWSTLSSIVDTDTNTTYTIKTETRSDGDYLVLTPSTGTATSIKLPESGSGSNIDVENYYAQIIEGSGGGSGEGGGSGTSPVIGDGATISISNNIASLIERNVSSTTTASTLNYNDDFNYIKSITVDEYGRLSSIVTGTATLPALNNNSAGNAGIVAAGNGNNNKVWKTNNNGVPAWRDEALQTSYASGNAIDISNIANNTRTISLASAAKTIHVGTTATAPTYANLCIVP